MNRTWGGNFGLERVADSSYSLNKTVLSFKLKNAWTLVVFLFKLFKWIENLHDDLIDFPYCKECSVRVQLTFYTAAPCHISLSQVISPTQTVRGFKCALHCPTWCRQGKAKYVHNTSWIILLLPPNKWQSLNSQCSGIKKIWINLNPWTWILYFAIASSDSNDLPSRSITNVL